MVPPELLAVPAEAEPGLPGRPGLPEVFPVEVVPPLPPSAARTEFDVYTVCYAESRCDLHEPPSLVTVPAELPELVTVPPPTLPELPECALPLPLRVARCSSISRAVIESSEPDDGIGDAKTWLVEMTRTLSAKREVRMMYKWYRCGGMGENVV